MKDAKPSLKIGFVGAKVAVQPAESLQQGNCIDYVARNEFDFTIKEIAEGRGFKDVDGISYRDAGGGLVHNRDRAVLEDMDQLPFVTDVYKRDLHIEDYFIGYLLHTRISRSTRAAAVNPAARFACGRRQWVAIAIAPEAPAMSPRKSARR